MPKSAEERIECLEKKVNLYRLLVTLLVVFILVLQRERVVRWIDGVESWFGKASDVRA